MTQMGKKLSSSQIIILGFALVILLGSLLLSLPIATQDGHRATVMEAVFTATSAVCVTGLVVQDTATYWSLFGQIVILLLIQIGGMGVITVAVVVAMVSHKKIGIKQRCTMQEAISAHKMGGIVRLTGFIVRTTLLLEGIGALLMAPVFWKQLGAGRGIWYAIFHSVSAMCNAGFDLMGIRGAFSSLTTFSAQPVINAVIIGLIVIGGIGFLTWDDIRTYRFHVRRYHMQSKVILVTTGLLIALPTVYFFFFELQTLPMQQRIWQSIFQAVTPRTAGFNTADLTKYSENGLLLTILLMLIGGSPGSTAGGMKTTTAAVILISAWSVFHREQETHFFGRRISEETIRNAMTILTLYLVLFLAGGCVISHLEGLPLLSCLFETASAIGTVGLTLGITPGLGTASHIILIALMYVGRVGGLTLIYSTMSSMQGKTSKLPQEKLTVG